MSLLDRQQAAKFLSEQGFRISAATLAKKAVQGNGCPYVIWNGRATYDSADLMEWALSCIPHKIRSTADRSR